MASEKDGTAPENVYGKSKVSLQKKPSTMPMEHTLRFGLPSLGRISIRHTGVLWSG